MVWHCDRCGLRCQSGNHLRSHLEKAHVEGGVQCPRCCCTFSTIRSVVPHMVRVHRQKFSWKDGPVVGESAKARLTSVRTPRVTRGSTSKNNNTIWPTFADIRAKPPIIIINDLNHPKSDEESDGTPRLPKGPNPKVKCSLCDYRCFEKSILKSHMSNCHNVVGVADCHSVVAVANDQSVVGVANDQSVVCVANDQSVVAVADDGVACSECPRTFSTTIGRNIHLGMVHRTIMKTNITNGKSRVVKKQFGRGQVAPIVGRSRKEVVPVETLSVNQQSLSKYGAIENDNTELQASPSSDNEVSIIFEGNFCPRRMSPVDDGNDFPFGPYLVGDDGMWYLDEDYQDSQQLCVPTRQYEESLYGYSEDEDTEEIDVFSEDESVADLSMDYQNNVPYDDSLAVYGISPSAFACDLCTRKLDSLKTLEFHKKYNHSHVVNNAPFLEREDGPTRPKNAKLSQRTNGSGGRGLACSKCGARFTCNVSRVRHEETSHVEDGEFPCEHCCCRFSLENGLRSHKGIYHTKKK